jgi:hypothetical protein
MLLNATIKSMIHTISKTFTQRFGVAESFDELKVVIYSLLKDFFYTGSPAIFNTLKLKVARRRRVSCGRFGWDKNYNLASNEDCLLRSD